MKTAVSLPDDVFESVERLRKLTNRQRSEVYADALREYVARHSDDEITAALARGDRVELRGFGAFSIKRRDARLGRNPRTGDSVSVDEKHIPFFKTGKQLRDRLNTGD